MKKQLLSSGNTATRQQSAERARMFLQAYMLRDEDAMRYCDVNGVPFIDAKTGERAQSAKDNTTGGVFVIPEIEKEILALRTAYGVFRRNANVKPMKSETKTILRRKGGYKAYPVAPGDFGTESEASWDGLELFARKWMVLTKTENELLDDSEAFMEELVNEMAYAFTYSEDDAGFNGDGSEKYHGVVGVISKLKEIAANPADIKGIRIASGNSWSEITLEDITSLISLLPSFARRYGSVKWYCSHEFWAKVLLPLEMAAGGVSYAEDEDGEQKPLFIGKMVEFVEVMPTTEANSQIPLLYGNLKQAALFGDRRGVTIKGTTSNRNEFQIDVSSIKATARFDINVHDVGDTEKAGAIVGLMTASS